MPNEVIGKLQYYVEKYNGLPESDNPEDDLVETFWPFYVGKFKKTKKRLNALRNVCGVMMLFCSRENSPQHTKLVKLLCLINQNSDYNSIVMRWGTLCPTVANYYSQKVIFRTCSYGTLMRSSHDAVNYLKRLLYFVRTGKCSYPKPCWLGTRWTYNFNMKIYTMFVADFNYIAKNIR
ncbi:MAG: hypothetical protein LBR79_00945 [Oscillospiraceae bacterium]|nr:hypothetical protein [Oscillospiraceae bacterium]